MSGPVPTAVAAAADRLARAAATGVPCAPIRDLVAGDDVDSAYAVQELGAARRHRDGHRLVGRKIGLTNPRVQQRFGIDRPDFGRLFDVMARAPDEPVSLADLLQPRLEAEIALVLGADLTVPADLGAPAARAAVAAAVEWVVPAFEIVDSRVVGWDITFVDTVADNGSAGLFVLGDVRLPLDAVDLPGVVAVMARTPAGAAATLDVSRGTGADALGGPLDALAWLAAESLAREVPLRAGDIVLTGALGDVVEVAPGDAFAATFTGLGRVDVRFAA